MSPSMRMKESAAVKESSTRLAAKADAYLDGLVDFIKWTAAFSVAASVWVANSFPPSEGISRCLKIASLTSLLVSVIVAIITVKRALDSWGNQWLIAKASHSLMVNEEFWALILKEEFLEKRKEEASELLSASLDAAKKFDHPKVFNRLTLTHMVLSVLGILLFVASLLI
jgi:hypothetical protein